jgi:hypothetical protein
MRGQFDNEVMSSVKLWLDNTILTKGEAYTNFGSKLFRIRDVYNDSYTYGLPFKQIISDVSITGATIMSGIYVNNVFVTKGTSGLIDINYEHGHAYFSNDMDGHVLSGNYAVKDFNINLTSEPEQKLLFKTKYETRPKRAQELTGLAPNALTYPVIFLLNQGSYNAPFAFGGLDSTHIEIRLLVLANNQFNLDAVCSIVRDRCKTDICTLRPRDLPFNSYGGLTGSYNYEAIIATKTNHSDWLHISRVDISRFSYQSVIMSELGDLNQNIFPALIDLELQAVRMPRG